MVSPFWHFSECEKAVGCKYEEFTEKILVLLTDKGPEETLPKM